MEQQCYFSKIDKCVCSETTELVKAGPQRVQTIKNCSRKYDDELYHELEENIEMTASFQFTHIDHVYQPTHLVPTLNDI